MPVCSVIMPAYNACETISESIESVRAQTFEDWELLVIDDCSTDTTADVVRHLANLDDRIKYFRMKANSGGPSRPRNKGVSEAMGRFIAFLDSDDIWYPAKLSRQLSAMKQFGWHISCTGFDVFKTDKEIIGKYVPPINAGYEQVLRENSLGCLSVVYDTQVLGKRLFPFCGHEDYALWLKITREGNVCYGLQEALCAYRLTPGSVSRNKLRVLRFFYQIYRRQEGFTPVRSAVLTLQYAIRNFGKYRRAGSPL